MKHKITMSFLILGLFIITQFIGLYVLLSNSLPDYLNSSIGQAGESYGYYFYQLISAFIISIMLFVLITKYKLKIFMRAWFFLVVAIALSISIAAIMNSVFNFNNYVIALAIGGTLSILKILRPSVLIHNGTELLIYPGIAAIFVPILNVFYVMALLILISIYDIWAVWHSGLMQKMAKFQIDELKIFGGLFIPYLNRQIKQKIIAARKSRNNKRLKRLKVSFAILGGGDIVFPLITAGIFLNNYGFSSAISIIFGAFVGLAGLLFFSEKKKCYPAMPFITAGIFAGIAVWFGIKFLI